MRVYLVTAEWQVAGEHAWDTYVFADKENAEHWIKEDKNGVLMDIEHGEYSESLEDYDVSDYAIESRDNYYDEWFSWSIEEKEVL